MSDRKVFYTDYPIVELGDWDAIGAPIRSLCIIAYDGDKYCLVSLSTDSRSLETEIKAGYIYYTRGRFGEVESISERTKGRYKRYYRAKSIMER